MTVINQLLLDDICALTRTKLACADKHDVFSFQGVHYSSIHVKVCEHDDYELLKELSCSVLNDVVKQMVSDDYTVTFSHHVRQVADNWKLRFTLVFSVAKFTPPT